MWENIIYRKRQESLIVTYRAVYEDQVEKPGFQLSKEGLDSGTDREGTQGGTCGQVSMSVCQWNRLKNDVIIRLDGKGEGMCFLIAE